MGMASSAVDQPITSSLNPCFSELFKSLTELFEPQTVLAEM
jgi:hypothetical protein